MERATDNRAGTGSGTIFRDLLFRLTNHAWLAFAYTVGMILAIYILGWYQAPSLLYLAVELPTFVAVVFILSRNPFFRTHAGFLWCITSVMVWAYLAEYMQDRDSLMRELLPACIVVLIVYWLLRATSYSKKEFSEIRGNSSLPYAIANLMAIWGAFLQIAFVALIPLRFLLQEEVNGSVIGGGLVSVLEAIRLASPLTWFPMGLIMLGLALFVIVGLQDDPYEAKDYKEVLTLEAPPVIEFVLSAMRLPIWLVIVILEFLRHLAGLAWRNLRSHADIWLGRFVVILFALVLPFLAMVAGHVSLFKSVALVSQYSSTTSSSFLDFWHLTEILLVHALILLALTLFVIAIGPIGMRVGSPIASEAREKIRGYLKREGFEAAQAVGKAFVLYALVVFAVPVASLLPGGARWGTCSTLYTLLLFGLGTSYVLWDRLPEEEKKKRQKALWRIFRKLGPTHEAGDASATGAQPSAEADG